MDITIEDIEQMDEADPVATARRLYVAMDKLSEHPDVEGTTAAAWLAEATDNMEAVVMGLQNEVEES